MNFIAERIGDHPYLFATGWTLAILAACSIPGDDIPNLGFDLFKYDKLVHFTLFFGFAFLWLRALPEKYATKFLWIGIAGLFYGVGTEIYQGMLPWERTPDPLDAIANMTGLFTAILLQGRKQLGSVANGCIPNG